ncbi:MAG: thiol-disulfide isomerase [Gammaproteobacteria bacterium]|nr:thiol-disulfide isomerase [Gammaproteobacteria bacterium]
MSYDEYLIAKYGQYIPVLSIEYSTEYQELRWPFGACDIERALSVS